MHRFSDIAGGYLCFVVSIFGIGVVTAVIGDVASYFGCTLGIKDSVTAVAFVALGTSIPGKSSVTTSVVSPRENEMGGGEGKKKEKKGNYETTESAAISRRIFYMTSPRD